MLFVCGRLAKGSLHHCSITGIAPESSSLRVNYFIRAVTERERERAECGHCACCCTGNDVRIGAKTYRIGHVIGADAFDAPTMGIYRSLTIKSDRSCLPSLLFFGILGEIVKLEKCHFGPSRAEMVRNTCFQSNIVSVTYAQTIVKGFFVMKGKVQVFC